MSRAGRRAAADACLGRQPQRPRHPASHQASQHHRPLSGEEHPHPSRRAWWHQGLSSCSGRFTAFRDSYPAGMHQRARPYSILCALPKTTVLHSEVNLPAAYVCKDNIPGAVMLECKPVLSDEGSSGKMAEGQGGDARAYAARHVPQELRRFDDTGGAHLGLSIQSSGFLSSGSSISSAGLMDGSKSSRMLPDFFDSPSMSRS